MLEVFYVVTKTSVYRAVSHDPSSGNMASVTKIVSKGESKIDVGGKVPGGSMFSIGRRIIAFIPEGGGSTSLERKIEFVNIRYWAGQTSAIVALFLDEGAARVCIEVAEAKSGDRRWMRETQEVLDALGDDHTSFSICRTDPLGFKFSED